MSIAADLQNWRLRETDSTLDRHNRYTHHGWTNNLAFHALGEILVEQCNYSETPKAGLAICFGVAHVPC